ncbi:MAG: hypothetical protein J6Q42_00530 [Clostridia bacterium]|nr:hypothetical protein [Clostridia bacterium]
MKKNKDAQMSKPEISVEEEQSTTTEFPSVLAVEPEFEMEEELPVKKKKAGFFHRRKEPREEPRFLIESPATFKNESGEMIKIADGEPLGDTCEISVSQDTKIIETDETEKEQEGSPITQLQLDGFEASETVASDEEDEAAALLRVRQEKIQDFSQRREQHEKELAQAKDQELSCEDIGEAEEQLLADEPVKDDEFTDYEQVADIQKKLRHHRHRARLSLLVSAVVEMVLFISALVSSALPGVAVNPTSYLLIQLILFICLCTISFPMLKGGFSKLFSGRVSVESGIALATVLTLLHTVLQFFNTSGIADCTSPLLTTLTGFSLLMLQLCRCLSCSQISRNFSAASVVGEKLVSKSIDEPSLAEEIGRPAVALGVPHVAYFRKTDFVTGFFKSTEDSSLCNRWMKWYLPLSLSLSAVLAVVYLLVNGLPSWIFAITLFCLMVCVSMPILLLVFKQSAFTAISLKLQKKKTAVMGYDAIQKYGSVHAVAVDATDLFPESSVLLHGIKTFSGTRIDEAILDAASVSIRAGGPLSHVFRRMILNKVDMLHEVDTLVYEQDMGLSGWVSGRRVLIGNRRLLDNHGIYIPSKDYEDRYAKDGRQLVYLSIAGELSAMFVVSYKADESVKQILKDVTANRVTLLIRTCDPNITEKLVASVFDVEGFYIELLGAPAGRSYEILTAGVSAEETASIVSFDGVGGMVKAISYCTSLRVGIRVFTILQTIVGLAALLIVGGLALFGGVMLSPLYALELLIIALAVTGAISLLVSRR